MHPNWSCPLFLTMVYRAFPFFFNWMNSSDNQIYHIQLWICLPVLLRSEERENKKCALQEVKDWIILCRKNISKRYKINRTNNKLNNNEDNNKLTNVWKEREIARPLIVTASLPLPVLVITMIFDFHQNLQSCFLLVVHILVAPTYSNQN